MSMQQIIILCLTFAVAFALTLGLLWLVQPDSLRKRITEISRTAETFETRDVQPHQDWLRTLERVSKPLAKLSLPSEGWDGSKLRTRFMNAGWRSSAATGIYFGVKTLLAIVLPVLLFLAMPAAWLEDKPRLLPTAMLGCALLGFYLPDVVLRRRIRQRQREIFESFPDALDLICVCVEAGLALDAALLKVVEEFRRERNALSDELELLVLELRAGLPREKALRNLGLRTGVEDVDMLVSMLIQADRFGTSVADALRVHADSLRVKRRQRAEEMAAKIAVKLLFPLIFFIFPSLMVVLLGSPAISFYRMMGPFMNSMPQ